MSYPDLNNLNLTEFEKQNIVIIKSNCRFINELYNSPLFHYRLEEIGIDLRYFRTQDIEHFVYHLLITRIFPLKPFIMKYVDDFSSDWNKYCVIGIHVRTGDKSLTRYPPEKSKVIKYIKPTSEKALNISGECKKPIKWYLFICIIYTKYYLGS